MYETIKKESALLVVVCEKGESWSPEALAEEFKHLVVSAGIKVFEAVILNLKLINPSLYVGKGKVEEIASIIADSEVDVVIFNTNLNYTQQRNLEEALGVKTLDRTQLILDIFAKHAHTQEGILQVELAQLEYMLPRLRGKGIMLSRLGGGIGTIGPGEKKLEVDRRRINDRISHLAKELKAVKQHRVVMRKKRGKENVSMCSLVGYTSAGKTTLFNTLTESSQMISSTLFTTLDTVSRALTLHKNLKVVISDTVGFIYKLPHNLVDSFKATLEELQHADVLLQVIDASNKDFLKLKKAVDEVLDELKLKEKTVINVFNKIDLLGREDINFLKSDYPQAIFVSAKDSLGIDALKEEIYKSVFKDISEVIVKVPFNQMPIINYFHRKAEVLKIDYQEEEIACWLRIKKDMIAYLQKKGLSFKEL